MSMNNLRLGECRVKSKTWKKILCNVDKFIEWILSPQGQIIVEKTGYTPLK